MQAMLFMSTLMLIIASLHLAVSSYRYFKDFVDTPFPTNISAARWDNQVITAMYVTQELLGSGAALYRCWSLWNKSWRVVMIPALLFLAELGIGYVPCSFYAKSDFSKGIIDPKIFRFIASFYFFTVATNIVTSGLMTYRLWSTHRNSHVPTKSVLIPIMWILVESAMLQLIVEVILLGLFLANSNAQYVFFGLVVPIIGITFTAITVRIKIVSAANAFGGSLTTSTSVSSSGVRYPWRSEGSRRTDIFTDFTNEENIFRTSDYYKTTQLSVGEYSRSQQDRA
ncbi:hypothetical protein VNI00_000247 [Paramarasmius palmivorus]|uniref:Uncharacterized protein n=1 Tax=Paramarasmius palmivorus TaxID=297713 RepID=A0AAW0EC71_9AGAR